MNKKTALVVDDDQVSLMVLCNFLEEWGLNLLVEMDGENAVWSAFNNQPDLILLDIFLPGMNGIEVCAKIKTDPRTRQIPVIFISALSKQEMIKQTVQAGAIGYVEKPVDFKVLHKIVNEIINNG